MAFELSVRCGSEVEAHAFRDALWDLGQEVEIRHRHYPTSRTSNQWFVLCNSTGGAEDTPSLEDFQRITAALERVHQSYPITGVWELVEGDAGP